jgi:hypothetical protein
VWHDNDKLAPAANHPAIQYWAGTLTDPASVLNAKLQSGDVRLQFAGPQGYLRSLLAALGVPVESQIAVFSKTGLQASRIAPRNPRTIFSTTRYGWPGCTAASSNWLRKIRGRASSSIRSHRLKRPGRCSSEGAIARVATSQTRVSAFRA